jgi:thiol-disulfide isomerase/thioredoxin
MIAAGPPVNLPPHCSFAKAGVCSAVTFGVFSVSAKPTRLLLNRRSTLAMTAGLAAGFGRGNYAAAQTSDFDLPAAGDALNTMMPQAAPPLRFTNAKGRALTLADYAGHGLVVNLWATWCGPCVAEIPSFAAAAPLLASSRILVLPISVDDTGAAAVRPFYASHHISTLPVLLNQDGSAMDLLNARGIPVTIIINAAGQMVARLEGAADWSGPATLAKIRALTLAAPGAAAPGAKPGAPPPAGVEAI